MSIKENSYRLKILSLKLLHGRRIRKLNLGCEGERFLINLFGDSYLSYGWPLSTNNNHHGDPLHSISKFVISRKAKFLLKVIDSFEK